MIEYRSIPEDAPWARESIVAEAPSKLLERRIIRLVSISEGYACAGSAARYDAACYGVLFDDNGARHGRRFKSESDARALFTQWTGVTAP